MAYSAVAGSELAVNKPITSSLITRINDNPIAIFDQLGWAVTASVYISPEQTLVSASTFTVNHGLTSFSPTNGTLNTFLICKTSQYGYTAGDIVPYNHTGMDRGYNTGLAMVLTSSQIKGVVGSGGLLLLDFATKTIQALAPSSWRLIVNLRG